MCLSSLEIQARGSRNSFRPSDREVERSIGLILECGACCTLFSKSSVPSQWPQSERGPMRFLRKRKVEPYNVYCYCAASRPDIALFLTSHNVNLNPARRFEILIGATFVNQSPHRLHSWRNQLSRQCDMHRFQRCTSLEVSSEYTAVAWTLYCRQGRPGAAEPHLQASLQKNQFVVRARLSCAFFCAWR